MNAINLYEAQKNGQDIVPQFAPPTGEYLINNKTNQIKDLTDHWHVGEYNNRRHIYDTNTNDKYYLDEGWQWLKNNEDLPQFADKKTQNMTMLYNALEALKTRQFNERMYDQRYQKIINDIKKAGLNPYAINFFSPGGVQSGSAASIMSNYQASQSHVRSQANIKSESKNENKNENKQNWGQFLIQAIMGFWLGLAGNAIKAIATAA